MQINRKNSFHISIRYIFVTFYLCIIIQNRTIDIKIEPNSLQLPIIKICNKFDLLLDTGSQQTWIADNSCINCPQKTSLCPHLTTNTQFIKYVKGQVKGDLIFLTSCPGAQKVVCVRQAKGMEQMQAMGIMGVKRGVGRDLLSKWISQSGLEQQKFAVYYGHKQSRFILGEMPLKYTRKHLQIVRQKQDWTISFFRVKFQQKKIDYEGKFFIDTGSNILIFPQNLFDRIVTVIKDELTLAGCAFIQMHPFTFKCHKIPQHTINIQIKQNSPQFLKILLSDLITFRRSNTFQLRIQSGTQDLLMIGLPLLKNYLIQFSLNGDIQIFESNRLQLGQQQRTNYIFLLIGYISIIFLFSFLGLKFYAILEQIINRKIVI